MAVKLQICIIYKIQVHILYRNIKMIENGAGILFSTWEHLFCFLHLYGGSQPTVTPIPGDPVPSSKLCQATDMHMMLLHAFWKNKSYT